MMHTPRLEHRFEIRGSQIGKSLHNPHAWRTQKSDVYGSTHIGVINSVLNSVKIIASGRIQVEPRQMPVCMKLGSSSHIEALVSMIELRNQIYTGGPRRLSNCIYATYECICVKYSAKQYVVSTLVCVGFVELFCVRFFTKQSSQRAYFYFHSPLYTRVWFCCAWCNSMAAFGYIWELFVAP